MIEKEHVKSHLKNLIGEWAKACRAEGMRFGVTFHHEYTWWWQTVFGSDKDGAQAKATQRVIVDFHKTTLASRSKVDTFSIVKFRKKTNGTVTTKGFGLLNPLC